MSYFKTSYSTLQALARNGQYEDVAGFLVMARHASGLAIAGHPPYTLSGAGVNSVHEKASMSEEAARGVLERLQEAGIIKRVTDLPSHAHARWHVNQGDLDLDLPHAFVDTSKPTGAASVLRRIKDFKVRNAYAAKLEGLSTNDVRLDALMLMLAVYRHTRMEAFGGIDPKCVLRQWTLHSRTKSAHTWRWGAEPDSVNTAFLSFMEQALVHRITSKGAANAKEVQWARFWNAWANLVDAGLIYEAVCLYDAEPATNESARMMMTLRVNDYHAGAISKTGDPSLLRSLEERTGADYAYYTPVGNERGEPEAMWVMLPTATGTLIGVWRPRFRASNSDTGAWIEKEEQAVAGAMLLMGISEPA